MARIKICSPGEYIQGNGEIKRLSEHAAPFGDKGAYIIVDSFIYKNYGQDIEGSFKADGRPYKVAVFGGECCQTEIKKHCAASTSYSVIIGIGGGKTLDTSKAAGYYNNMPVMIVPTAASSDAPCSRLSVVYTESGEFEDYLPLPKNPDMVLVDTDVVAKAPARFLAAGIGDALATYYEAAACVASNAVTMTGGHSTLAAFSLAKLCRDTLLEDGIKAYQAVLSGVRTKAVENVIEANTYLSGIGFESCGLAAAHAVHNGMTVLEETHKLLHGEKVAFGTITQLVLENCPSEELTKIIAFCKKIGLPTTFADLGIEGIDDDRLMKVAELSCADNDTMGNMPFDVEPGDVFSAMKAADFIASGIASPKIGARPAVADAKCTMSLRKLNMDEIKDLSSILSKYQEDFEIMSGKYISDAKSMLGLLNIDWDRGAELIIHRDDPALIKSIKKFVR
ncbi:MAG: glycerol dehydrogenase [Eubacterium sp.]|nr:glycerol dehydrogenase [Eubacterium sp.]